MDTSEITILNVDGNEISLYAKSRILREAGYRIIEAKTGAEALLLARRESPHLVLLSADLPDWSGFEALGRIKTEVAISSQSAPPLVLLVSATFVGCENRARALEEGADGYLLEPASPEFLLANIKMLLRRLPSAVEIARSIADEWRRGRALDGGAEFAILINSVESLEEILRIAANEARGLIGAHQAIVGLNPEALDLNSPSGAVRPGTPYAISLSEKYARKSAGAGSWPCETWFSSLVCRLNQPMRLAQDELESQLDPGRGGRNEADKDYESYRTYKTCRHPQELEEIMTPREVETLRRMACLRAFAGLREVATPGEIAGLREAVASRDPQLIPGLDMRGWIAAPITSGAGGYGRNLGLIQLSEKHDGEFTEQDEATLAKLARIVSVAVENRLRWRHEQNMREAAERAARAKDEYMAMTSYKLRAQLNTLLGWSWVLRRQADNMEGVARAAEIIERAARTQAQLVEDLLGTSRKGAVIWKGEGGTQGRKGGGIAGWAEGEAEVWMEPSAEGQWEKNTEEWTDGASLDFSDAPAFRRAAAPSLRSAARRSHGTSMGLAAGGGC